MQEAGILPEQDKSNLLHFSANQAFCRDAEHDGVMWWKQLNTVITSAGGLEIEKISDTDDLMRSSSPWSLPLD